MCFCFLSIIRIYITAHCMISFLLVSTSWLLPKTNTDPSYNYFCITQNSIHTNKKLMIFSAIS